MNIDLRTLLIGRNTHHSLTGVVVASGLFGAVLLTSFLPVSVGWVLEPGLVVTGFGLAGWWAYRNSGLAVSVTLVLFPVLGRLSYYSWLYAGRPSPVALPLSFSGIGAWEMWVPVAIFLGSAAFGVGSLLRWVNPSSEKGTRSVS